VRGGGVADHPLADQLRLPVRGLRAAGGVLGDDGRLGVAVDGGRGGEDEAAHARLDRRLQQGPQAFDVLLVVPERLVDRLADLLLPGGVDDAVDPVLGEGAGEQFRVAHGADDERHGLGQPVLLPRGQVVQDDDAARRRVPAASRSVAHLGEQSTHHVRADVARATGYQPSRHAFDPNGCLDHFGRVANLRPWRRLVFAPREPL
jgi:hypothetical protein